MTTAVVKLIPLVDFVLSRDWSKHEEFLNQTYSS